MPVDLQPWLVQVTADNWHDAQRQLDEWRAKELAFTGADDRQWVAGVYAAREMYDKVANPSMPVTISISGYRANAGDPDASRNHLAVMIAAGG